LPKRSHQLVTLSVAVAISGMASCYKRHEVPRTAKITTETRSVQRATEKAATDARPEHLTDIPVPSPQPSPTEAGLKVALFGDQGVRATSRAVLQLIAREHADMVIHLGDLSYDEASPSAWEAQVDSVLGPDFPYFAVIGNHDIPSWFSEGGFAQRFSARLSRMTGAHCQGEYAINASCTFRGLHFVLSGVGTYGHEHESFLRHALETSHAQHNLCVWHKNQRDMQVGGKIDEVGWQAYQICAERGVPIITGHEHSYSRTYALSALGDRKQGHGAGGLASELLLGPGRTFVVVSGLGGESIRPWTPDHKADSWWASIYAGNLQVLNGETQGVRPRIDFGVLFITYGVDGDPLRAGAYFKTTADEVADLFSWRSEPVVISAAK
jgi:3',5'-cyclic AMP phosphodiesterase CpdA